MRIALQVGASLLLVVVVLWAMWRLPRKDDTLLAWGPPLALLSAWSGLAAVIASVALWVVRAPDTWVTVVMLALDPAAIASGVLVLWLHRTPRGREAAIVPEPVLMQKLQARVGIGLGLAAVAIGYTFVMTSKAPLTPIGQ